MAVILLIDDDDFFRDMMIQMLSREGYQVLGAENGYEAEKLLDVEAIDLVITDIVMPDKEGIETIRDIKSNWPDMPIIAVSGGARIKPGFYLDVAAKLGVAYTFQKPFERKTLINAVKKCLEMRNQVKG
ncbi:MAG: response regulator [Spirochaetales bacterium]|nr:response regulator [Spirochaetales bacterium]